MKRVLVVVGLLMAVGWVNSETSTAQAQPYPNRSIQLIIPIPAGGGGDVNARLLLEDLGKTLGTQVVAVNKPGACRHRGYGCNGKEQKGRLYHRVHKLGGPGLCPDDQP